MFIDRFFARSREFLGSRYPILCGARTICFASTEPLAMSLIERGADALMLEGSEAGGHIGPVALSVLIQQILFQAEAEDEFQRLSRELCAP